MSYERIVVFAQIKARIALTSAVVAYAKEPTETNEKQLATAFGVVIGKPLEEWSERERALYEEAKAQRPEL